MKNITLIISVIFVGILLFGCTQTTPVQYVCSDGKVVNNADLCNAKVIFDVTKEIPSDLSQYLSFSYDCNDIGGSVKCDGIISYIGPSMVEISGGQFIMYCYKPLSTSAQCTIDTNSMLMGTMSTNQNQLPFTTTCKYGNNKNFTVKLLILNGIFLYPAKCD